MKTKKLFPQCLLALFIVCLLLAPMLPARAQGTAAVAAIPADRVRLLLLPGVVYDTASVADGQVSVTIDTAASDLGIAASCSGIGELKQQIIVTAPAGAASYKYLNRWYPNDSMLLAAFDSNSLILPANGDSGYSLFMPIGALNGENGLFTPAPGMQTCALQWFDANGDLLLTEKTSLLCSYTSEAQAEAELFTLGLTDAVPNAESLAGVSSRLVDGVLVYTLPEGWSGQSIRTDIPAPVGAASYTLSDYAYKPERYSVENGCASHFLYTGPQAQSSYETAIAWYASNGACIGGGRFTIRSEKAGKPVVQKVPVSRLHVTSLPVGMDAVVSKTDGDLYCFVDDEATNWDQAVTFNKPVIIYDPDTDQTYPLNNAINFGFTIDKPEGASSVAYGPGRWESDEALAAAMENAELTYDNSYPSWMTEIVTIEDDQVTLVPIGGKDYDGHTTYAVRWADENGDTLLIEKVELFVEFATAKRTYPVSPLLIPAEDIRPNATGESYAFASVTDGHVTTLFTEAWPSLFTEVDVPAGTVSYSMCEEYFKPNAERYPLTEGSFVGFQLEGWTNGLTPSTSRRLLCWYDANGKLTGGGWLTSSAAYRPEGDYPAFVLPASLKTVAQQSFDGADVQKAYLPAGCTAVEARAFAHCPGLLEAHIPASVTTIAPDAFEGCSFVIIYAPAGSAAAAYAEANGIAWFAEE